MRLGVMVTAAVITIALVLTARTSGRKDEASEWSRTMTAKGPVYVYSPPTRDPKQGVVIYVHGLGSAPKGAWYVDKAWVKHGIFRKFKKSGSKAALVAVASWSGKRGVQWNDLDDLLAYLETKVGKIQYVHVIGHSGAWKNLSKWATNKRLNHLTLLDATYSGLDLFHDFGKRGRLDVAVSKGGSPSYNAKKVLKGNSPCELSSLQDVSLSTCRVTHLELPIKHMEWVTGDALVHFYSRGSSLRSLD